jgi:hypothetical protein
MLRADLDAPRKQVHTVKRVFDRLVAEHEMEGISYAIVADYARWRRPAIRVEEGRGPAQVFIPQVHRPGAEAEVDFGDVWIMLAGVLTKCYLFTFRLSYSGKSVHRVTVSCGQEAFFEGHMHARRIRLTVRLSPTICYEYRIDLQPTPVDAEAPAAGDSRDVLAGRLVR